MHLRLPPANTPENRMALAVALGTSALATPLLSPAIAAALAVPAFALARGAATPLLQHIQPALEDRTHFVRQLDQAIARGQANGRNSLVLLLRVDASDILEERLDHPAREALLTAVARKLRRGVRREDALARLDGYTFALGTAPDHNMHLKSALQLAARLQARMREPLQTSTAGAVRLRASVGFCLSSRLPGAGGEPLLHAASVALVEATRHGPGAIRSYSRAMMNRTRARRTHLSEIESAMDRGEIIAHFQPQIFSRSGKICGAEALARWQHPNEGLIPPAEFLPVITEAGLLPRLCDLMLAEALNLLDDCDRNGLSLPQVSINLAQEDLEDPSLVSRVDTALSAMSMHASRIRFEVLETVIAGKYGHQIERNLRCLTQKGVELDLDDFGTGHASISTLRAFSVNRVKIDRSFVKGIDNDIELQNIVRTMVQMARQLKLDILAEGVETPREETKLKSLGCDALQGYLYAKPASATDFITWMKTAPQSGKRPAPSLKAVS
jgi:diguanylate cyclase (GGDEF)-like protein